MTMSDQNETRAPVPGDLLRGRVALVTGASRGIGRATALRLAEAGAHVAVGYARQRELAEAVARECERSGVEAVAVGGDVADPRQAEALASAALERFGRIDVLVANAGIWEGAPVEEMSEELWDRVLDANLKGTWTVCRAAVPAMKRHGGGRIVIISSTAGQRGEAFYSNYAASKGGQISFAKSLAAELAPAIRVNAVAPGWVETELSDPAYRDAEYKQKIVESIPLRRIATPDDVALAVLYLASDWSRHLTGEILNVNGGSVLCG